MTRTSAEIEAEIAAAQARVVEIDGDVRSLEAQIVELKRERDGLTGGFSTWRGRISILERERDAAVIREADETAPRVRARTHPRGPWTEYVAASIGPKQCKLRPPGIDNAVIWKRDGRSSIEVHPDDVEKLR